MSRTVITAEWAGRVRAEYESSAVAARLLHSLLLAGAPVDLVRTAHRVVADELDHSLLCHQAYLDYGGADESLAHAPRIPAAPASADELVPLLVADVLRGFCFGETLAAPFFVAMLQRASGPAREVLGRVVLDEPTHAKLGWDCLDWLREIGGGALEPVIGGLIPGLIEDFAGLYDPRRGPGRGRSNRLSDAERAAGLLAPEEFATLFWRTLDVTILPRFTARGVQVPTARRGR